MKTSLATQIGNLASSCQGPMPNDFDLWPRPSEAGMTGSSPQVKAVPTWQRVILLILTWPPVEATPPPGQFLCPEGHSPWAPPGPISDPETLPDTTLGHLLLPRALRVGLLDYGHPLAICLFPNDKRCPHVPAMAQSSIKSAHLAIPFQPATLTFI